MTDGNVKREDVVAWLVEVHEDLMDELRARGWTDEEIERGIEAVGEQP